MGLHVGQAVQHLGSLSSGVVGGSRVLVGTGVVGGSGVMGGTGVRGRGGSRVLGGGSIRWGVGTTSGVASDRPMVESVLSLSLSINSLAYSASSLI